MLNDLQKLAQRAVETATAAGASDAWAHTERSRTVDYRVRNGKLEEVKDSTARSLSVQLYVEGRYATHATTDLRPTRLSAWIEETLAMTRALQPDGFRVMPDARLFEGAPSVKELELADENLSHWNNETRLSLAQRMNAQVHGKPRVISVSSEVSDTHALSAAASSNGFCGHYETTSVGLATSCTLEDGAGRAEDWMGTWGHHESALLKPETVGDEALKRSRARLGSTKGPTLTCPLVIDPRAGGSLIGRLLWPATGQSVQQDRSFWKNTIGKRQVSPKLTVVDDPTIPRGLSSRPFDREGIASKPLPLIEAGVFANLYLDTYYSAKLKLAPTTGQSSNRVVEPGARPGREIIRDVDNGVYVTSWLGGNMDGTTGDFSLGIRGHLIEKGTLGAPVGEMNVTGNILKLFDRLVEVGNDPWPFAPTLVPTLAFDDVDFSGA